MIRQLLPKSTQPNVYDHDYSSNVAELTTIPIGKIQELFTMTTINSKCPNLVVMDLIPQLLMNADKIQMMIDSNLK